MTLRVPDHALVRFLERAGALDVEAVRLSLAASLARSAAMAAALGAERYEVHADGLVYVVRDATLVTILPGPGRR